MWIASGSENRNGKKFTKCGYSPRAESQEERHANEEGLLLQVQRTRWECVFIVAAMVNERIEEECWKGEGRGWKRTG